MMMAAVATMSQTILLSALSELGDKTFFLTAIFAVWCPFGGIRSGRNSTVQQCLVAAGCTVALATRVVLAAWGVNLDGTDSWLGLASVLLLCIMAAKAVAELRRADLQKKAEFWNQKPPMDPRHFGRGGASFPDRRGAGGFLGDFTAYNPENYQTEAQATPSSWNWLPSVGIGGANHLESPDPRVPPNYGSTEGLASTADPALAAGPDLPFEWACALAFLVPLVAIFVAEAGDKSQAALQSVQGAGAIGVLIGYSMSTMFAVFLGFLLERTVSERRVLFAVGLGLACLSMVLLSQGFLASNQGLFLSLRNRGAAAASTARATAKAMASPSTSLVATATPAASSVPLATAQAAAVAPLVSASMAAAPAATAPSSDSLLVPDAGAVAASPLQGSVNGNKISASFVQVPQHQQPAIKPSTMKTGQKTKTKAVHGQAERASIVDQPGREPASTRVFTREFKSKSKTK